MLVSCYSAPTKLVHHFLLTVSIFILGLDGNLGLPRDIVPRDPTAMSRAFLSIIQLTLHSCNPRGALTYLTSPSKYAIATVES